MIKSTFRLALLAPFAIALASCGSSKDGDDALSNGPVAAIAAPAGTSWTDKVTKTEEEGYLVGNPDAPIKVIEYGSLTCPTCALFGREGIQPLLSNYVESGRVSFELRNFAVHGTVDLILARLARCGPDNAVIPLSDQVWVNLDQVLEPLRANGESIEQAMTLPMDQRFAAFAQRAGLLDFFAARGISEDQGRACLADVPAMETLANATERYSKEFKVNGTPTFFLNGQMLDGVNTWDKLEPALQRAGAR